MSNFFDFNQRDLKGLSDHYSLKYKEKIKLMSDEPYTDDLFKTIMEHDRFFNYRNPIIGEEVTGKIIGQRGKWLILDAGFKDDVYVEVKGQEYALLNDLNLNVGDELTVLITNVNPEDIGIIGSYVQLQKKNAHVELSDSLDGESSYEAYVKELKAAGYFVDILINETQIEAFMPNTLSGINKLPNPESLIGQTIKVMIENETKDGFIASRKKYLESLIGEELKKIEIGAVYKGQVTGTTDFGIFVEFNKCLTGMIHRANVNPELVPNMQNIPPGTGIEFYVKEIIKGKLILTQVWRETLWDTIKTGDILEGKVRSKKPFGILVELDDETTGLVHINELERKNHPSFDKGDPIKVKIVQIQRADRKISLTLED